MTQTRRKYTKEKLQEAASGSISYSGVLRHLGLKQSGGSHSHIKRMMTELEVDTSHFKSQAWNRGNADPKRLAADKILVYDRNHGRKEGTVRLRRALLEIGRPHQCACGLKDEWNGKPIVLQIDHISGDWLDNRAENLRFLCPNCHSQTETFNRPKQ